MTVGATPPPPQPPAMPSQQFQPYHQPPPPPRRPGVHGFSVAAALLALVAAGLLIFGSFLPYTEYLVVNDGEQSFSQQTTGWEWIMEQRSSDGPSFQETVGAHPPRFGIALTVAAAVLLIGAFVTGAGAGKRTSTGARSMSRLLLSTSTVGAVVAVWMVALTASSLQSMATMSEDDSSFSSSFRTVYNLGTGLWVLVCGAGVALLGLIVAWLPNPNARAVGAPNPGVQMYLEPNTPPGYPPPHQQYPAPPPPPTAPSSPEPYISPFTQVATTESITAQQPEPEKAGTTTGETAKEEAPEEPAKDEEPRK
ncbi:hypothetical protein [Amycolatopsis magusensis]|uniref:hypothetical protein n=1 Tax=Amycolatopsis magusensis TaxID=882444 RepID=UPI0037B22F82